jgi:hypothetical protein
MLLHTHSDAARQSRKPPSCTANVADHTARENRMPASVGHAPLLWALLRPEEGFVNFGSVKRQAPLVLKEKIAEVQCKRLSAERKRWQVEILRAVLREKPLIC